MQSDRKTPLGCGWIAALLLLTGCTLLHPPQSDASADAGTPGEERYDPSDPTRIDARLGFGWKHTDYEPGGHVHEGRGKLALQVAKRDLLVADLGFGSNRGTAGFEDELGVTDGRFRWFRLWDMDRSLERGWQGWGTSVELQTPGSVPGTDGAAQLALGGLGAIGLGPDLNAFINPIVSSLWSRKLDDHLGVAARLDLIATYKPQDLWRGAYFKARPSVGYGLSDALQDDLNAMLEVSVGGAVSTELWWDVQARGFSDQELDRDSEGAVTGLADDWSIFVSFTRFL